MPPTKNKKGKDSTKEERRSKKRSQRSRRTRSEARADVKAAYAPLDVLLQREQEAIGPIYDTLGDTLGGLLGQYQQGFQPVLDSYTQAMAGLGGVLGGAAGDALKGMGPPGSISGAVGQAAAQEAGLSGGLLGTIAAGGLERLHGTEARNLGYMTSVGQQGALERVARMRDLWRDREDLRRQMARELLAQQNQRRREAQEMALARAGMRMQRDAFDAQQAAYNMGGLIAPGGGGGGGGGGGRRTPTITNPGWGHKQPNPWTGA